MENSSNGSIIVYSTVWCPDCKRAKKFFGEQRIPYTNIDIEKDSEAMAFVERVNYGKHIIPTIVFPDGTTLVEPTNAQLAEKLGLQTRAPRQFYDCIVVGGGPAGLTAALYLAREGVDTLVIERAGLGGQISTTQALENFPGFDEGISGPEFSDRLERQARRFGVEIMQANDVQKVFPQGPYWCAITQDGIEYGAKAMLLTTGARYRKMWVPGEEELIGNCIHFCASCDGPFYKGKDVLVIGGGNSGFEEALFLTRIASVEREYLGGTCINVGCTPTKTMVASARVAYLARRAADYGVHTGPVTVNLGEVRQRKMTWSTPFVSSPWE
jgi:thioredoxin reductase (NADPH)